MSIRTKAIALAAAAGIGAFALSAGPAFAATGPSAQATITVNQAVSIAITSPSSFSLTPGVMANGILTFLVNSNDNAGYTVSVNDTGDPMTPGGTTFPSADLTYSTGAQGGGQVDQCTGNGCALTTGPVLDFTHTGMSGGSGDNFSMSWLASLSSNVLPGSYSTDVVLTVAGK
jgi:hypothetical protein